MARKINRRPWRRPPWRKRRATEWFDANSWGSPDLEESSAGAPCQVPPWTINCDPMEEGADVRSSGIVVWAGPSDAEHIDNSTALIERIVGSILVRAGVGPGIQGPPYDPEPWNMPVVRMGLLAVEEIAPGQANEYARISLFDSAMLQDYEWMWLKQVAPVPWAGEPVEGSAWTLQGQEIVDLDVRTKRKLGRQDAVLLLASYVLPMPVGDPPFFDPLSFVHVLHQLRVLHSVK